jgi:hypothetical protein
VKLTAAQLVLLDSTTLAVVRARPQAGFSEIDSHVHIRIGAGFGTWSFRLTDRALQRLRRKGLIRCAHQHWYALPQSDTAQKESSS